MSDDGERTCPLCAEEMDLTDLQLKPCRCGYEICIWCWHHIIEMAEKDDTEARCPACRTPYDKDKVLKVAAANSERIIAEVYTEKKQRSQRAKPKISAEAMKHLSSVRVMQKNLVYITGLPSNLCDESILDRKEYFGQYGKVLKVSISRPAGTSSQKTSSNNTFGVYITYVKEDEAVRCIQAVHNYVLEGKSLRACFGTTKYCRAWLRNMTCSNPDCLYLHDIGSQEDSFTKDEIISAYTRSRIPQIALNNSRRSGNVLPPPMDDFHNKGTGLEKHPVKSACNSTSNQVKGSLSNPINGKSNGLPAAASWGHRGSNGRALTSSMPCSQTLTKQKVETSNNLTLPALSTAIPKQPLAQQDEVLTTSELPESNMEASNVSGLQFGARADSQPNLSSETTSCGDCSLSSSWNDDPIIASKPEEEMEDLDDNSVRLESLGPDIGSQYPTSSELLIQVVSEITNTSQVSSSCLSIPLAVALEDVESGIKFRGSESKPGDITVLNNHVKQISNSDSDGVSHDSTTINSDIQSLGSGFSSGNVDGHMVNELNIDHHQTTVSNLSSAELPRSRDFNTDPEVASTIESTDWNSESQRQQLIKNGIENPLTLHNDHSSSCTNHQHNKTDHTSSTSRCNGIESQQLPFTDGSLDMDRKLEMAMCSLGGRESVMHNGSREDDISLNCLSRNSSQSPGFNCTRENMRPLGRKDVTNTNNDVYVDKMGESSIISDILSLDFDPWDDSVSSTNTLAKLLGEKEKQEGSLNLSSSLKSATNNQSRFSFARQESLASYIERPVSETSIAQRLHSSQDSYQDNFQHGLQFNGSDGSRFIGSGDTSSNVTNSVLRTKITAPPGFTAPSRVPPPGFSSQDTFNPTYEAAYIGTGGNHYQSHSVGNSGDVEFIDPAILAIGKGRLPVEPNNSALGLKSSFPAQFITSDSDPRFNLMSQQSISSHQNMRMQEHMGERYVPLNDSYITSRLLAQNHPGISPLAQLSFEQLRNPLFSNGHWDAWNSMRTGNDIGLSEVFRNERFGLNDYYTSADENKFRMQSAGNLYNRAFGM